MKTVALALSLFASSLVAAASANASVVYTYVGSWAVADGPLWSGADAPGNAPPLSGRQTAALLFGGVATDYAISTTGTNPLLIDFLAFLDGFADTLFLTTPQSQDFVGIAGPNYASGSGNYSAYVFDHACGIHYCDNGGGENARNYAFRVSEAPEPATIGMIALALLSMFGLSFVRRRAGA